jgi:hypothetical protein
VGSDPKPDEALVHLPVLEPTLTDQKQFKRVKSNGVRVSVTETIPACE